jgi:predicted dehydrogenase
MTPFVPIIVGFGHSGRHLHYAALRQAADCHPHLVKLDECLAVDPAADWSRGAAVAHASSLPPRSDISGETVVHICTPPETHYQVLLSALGKGYRRFIVEKPLAISAAQATAMVDVVDAYGASMRVVALWPHSWAISALRRVIASNLHGPLQELTIVQNKPRFFLTRQRVGESVLFIEVPHQVALALSLAGEAASLNSAHAWPMRFSDRLVPQMGGCVLRLAHASGVKTTINSALDHHARERWVSARFADGSVASAYLSVSRDDLYAQLKRYGPNGSLIEHVVDQDDAFAECLGAYYHHFSAAELTAHPDYDLNCGLPSRNVAIISILEQACALLSEANEDLHYPHLGISRNQVGGDFQRALVT